MWLISRWDENLHALQPVYDTRIQKINGMIDGQRYTYWGYYCNPDGSAIGLAGTNDLDGNWHKYSGNPIMGKSFKTRFTLHNLLCLLTKTRKKLVSHHRWPSVTYVDNVFHMFYCDKVDRKLIRTTSSDGKTFVEQEVIESGDKYYNPFICKNPNDSKWYLHYHRGPPDETNVCRVANSIARLGSRIPTEVLDASDVPNSSVCASPSVMYFDSQYYLSIETMSRNTGGKWVIRMYKSTSPTSGFEECYDSPKLTDNDACPILLLTPSETTICCFFNNQTMSGHWEQHVITDNR